MESGAFEGDVERELISAECVSVPFLPFNNQSQRLDYPVPPLNSEDIELSLLLSHMISRRIPSISLL